MGQKTVLVVEDDSAVRAMLSLVLETRDFAVTTAEDGQQALMMIQAGPPDAILLDLMLPNIDGFSVIETLYHDARLARIPIIVMSAGHRLKTMDNRGVRAFLSKPFDIDGLIGALEDALGSAPSPDATRPYEPGSVSTTPEPSGLLHGPRYGAGLSLH